MSTRRRFLGTIVKALGAGGLLLPGTGRGAFALPTDLGEAARLPVTATPLPFSDEALALRKIRRALNALPPSRGEPDGGAWHRMMVGEYQPLKTRLADRPVRSWADCVELAEAIWAFWEKEHHYDRYAGPMTSKLYVGSNRPSIGYHQRDLIVALVEGVLSLGGGERFDPRMTDEERETP